MLDSSSFLRTKNLVWQSPENDDEVGRGFRDRITLPNIKRCEPSGCWKSATNQELKKFNEINKTTLFGRHFQMVLKRCCWPKGQGISMKQGYLGLGHTRSSLLQCPGVAGSRKLRRMCVKLPGWSLPCLSRGPTYTRATVAATSVLL